MRILTFGLGAGLGAAAVAVAAALSGGCGTSIKTLMPTPVLFTELGIDPVGHVPEAQRFPPRRVYYATTRARDRELRKVEYGNKPGDTISVGLSLIGFGNPTLSWEELQAATKEADRGEAVILSVNGVVEGGGFDPSMTPDEAAAGDAAGWWLADLADSIRDARDRDVLIYVHGAKVDFYNGCAFAAQLDHFMGRDMTSLAFCWPTRQDIFNYAFGTDVKRAEDASSSLASLLELVAAKTEARKIHVVAWSAGARVLTDALLHLQERYPELDQAELQRRFRIGTAYFAAGDIPRQRFIGVLPTLCSVSERVIVSVTDNDIALLNAKFFMGGGTRLGQKGPGEITQEQLDLMLGLDEFEVLDVSRGADVRGFDITGHEYWFSNPWSSSDLLLAVRSDLPPAERGLEQGDYPFLWYLPADYPERLKNLPARSLLRNAQ